MADKRRGPNRDHLREIIITCVGCDEETTVRVPKPDLELVPDPESMGQFCIGWNKDG